MEAAKVRVSNAPGVTGTRFDWAGKPELEHNVEVLLEEYLGNYYTVGVADKMRSDPKLARIYNLIRFPILAAKPTIKPASEQPVDMEIAEAARFVLFKAQNHRRFLRHALLSLVYGFVPFAYGRLFFDAIPGVGKKPIIAPALTPRKPSTIWEWGPPERQATGGKFSYMIQQAEQNHTIELKEALVVAYDEEFGNPMGRALWRDLYACYRNKLKTFIFAMTSAQRFGGFPVLEGYEKATDKTAIETIMANITMNAKGYIAIPDTWGKFDLKFPANAGLDQYLTMMKYWDQAAAEVILSDFLELGKGDGGSLALGQTKAPLFYGALDYFTTILADPLNHASESTVAQAYLRRFVDDNWGPQYAAPEYLLEINTADAGQISPVVDLLLKLPSLPTDDQIKVRQKLDYLTDEIREDIEAKDKAADAAETAANRKPSAQDVAGRDEERKNDNDEPPGKKNFGDHPCGDDCGCTVKNFAVFDAELRLSRQPTELEMCCNFQEMNLKFNSLGRAASEKLQAKFLDVVQEYGKKFSAAVKSKDFLAVRKIKLPPEAKTSMVDIITEEVEAAYEYGGETIARELDHQGAVKKYAEGDPPRKKKSAKDLTAEGTLDRALIDMTLDEMWSTVEENARRGALREMRLDDPDAQRIIDDLLAIPTAAFNRVGGYAVSLAINQGRTDEAFVRNDEIDYGEYSAILDGKTCAVCARSDGTRFAPGKVPSYLKAPNPNCLGTESRCRCIHVFRLKGEAEASA